VRHALITVSTGATLVLGWFVGETLLDSLNAPPGAAAPYDLVLVGVILALPAALAAVGLMMQRAWAADLLSAAAFLCSLPIAGLLTLSVAWPPTSDTPSARWGLILSGALGLALTVGVAALKLGRSIRRERAERP
jgi:hypothetical protein